GIHADVAAVRAAIALPWSNGPVEGEINRLKTIKRQMYGRAGFDLPRQRGLCAAGKGALDKSALRSRPHHHICGRTNFQPPLTPRSFGSRGDAEAAKSLPGRASFFVSPSVPRPDQRS